MNSVGYAVHGEVPITDPRVFPTLYFLKGALAVHALRQKLGDKAFFTGFKRLFAKPSKKEFTLDDYRQCFERGGKVSLKLFIRRWYRRTGLPE